MDDIAQKILALTKKKMREAGAYDYDAYLEFIDESLEYYVNKGLIDIDENTEFIKDQLEQQFDTVADALADE